MSGYRRPTGGKIVERGNTIAFNFDGKQYFGLAGDTLAAALMASGVMAVGRSRRLHRPRGIMAAGMEEPNALVTVIGADGLRTPNVPATELEIHNGLTCESQNRFPSLDLDLLAASRMLSGLVAPGAEYRSFLGPTFGLAKAMRPWMAYERQLRRLAGLGSAGTVPDTGRYERAHAHCDVLVVGAGKPGIEAALTAARRNQRVIICEVDAQIGGYASWSGDPDISAMITELTSAPNVRVLTRTTVWRAQTGTGQDDTAFSAVERVSSHRRMAEPGAPQERHWLIRADHVALATGAIERPLAFAGNDVPGVMLASAAQRYAGMYGAMPGKRIVIATNNDSAYATAIALKARDANIVAIVDLRTQLPEAAHTMAAVAGAQLRPGQAVLSTSGGAALEAVTVAPYRLKTRKPAGTTENIACDCLLLSGGWSPALDLAVQMGAQPVWSDRLQAYVVTGTQPNWSLHGAADGVLEFGDGLSPVPVPIIEVTGDRTAFIDHQGDLTATDVRQATRQGFATTGQLRRFIGLAASTDRGRTARDAAQIAFAHAGGTPVGTSPPPHWQTPAAGVALGTLAAERFGSEPQSRLTPLHDWHGKNGAPMQTTGQWRRPVSYNRWNEKTGPASLREVRIARATAAIHDASALGKVDVRGPDAGDLLDRIVATRLSTLGVGRTRHAVMLREDGFVLDTVMVFRLAEQRFMVTTLASNADAILRHIEFHNDVSWPQLKAHVTDVTDQWATIALAGPRSRTVLEACVLDTDVDGDTLPVGSIVQGRLADVPIMIARVSHSGELGFELYCAAGYGIRVWDAVLAAGEPHSLGAAGDVAMRTLRVEKGRLGASEIDGRTTARDLHLDRMVADDKAFVGSALMDRLGLVQSGRQTLVGVIARGGETINGGGHLIAESDGQKPAESVGHLTVTCFSPHIGCYIGLALLAEGRTRIGQTLHVVEPVRSKGQVRVEIVRHNMVDPSGARMHG